MSRPIYRRDEAYVKRIRNLVDAACNQNRDRLLDHWNLAIINNIRIRVTPRELTSLQLYYVRMMSMASIALEMGINVSTVSRNIKRGEGKISKVLSLAKEISPIEF